MPTLLIAYELADPGLTAPPLVEAILSLGGRWARPLASVWYVDTSASTAEVEARLAGFLDDDDGLLVQQAIGDAALANTMLRWTPARRERREAMKHSAPTDVLAGGVGGQVINWPNPASKIAAAA